MRFLEGWGVTADENARAKFAQMATDGEQTCSSRFVMPRDIIEDNPEYRVSRLRAARLDLLAQIDDMRWIPAGPISETVRHFSWKSGPEAEIPEGIDDWDHEMVLLSCRVWKLAE